MIGFMPRHLFRSLFTIFIYFIKVLVVFLQAFIFTNLTAAFIARL